LSADVIISRRISVGSRCEMERAKEKEDDEDQLNRSTAAGESAEEGCRGRQTE